MRFLVLAAVSLAVVGCLGGDDASRTPQRTTPAANQTNGGPMPAPSGQNSPATNTGGTSNGS
jgi:hypothetical protein